MRGLKSSDRGVQYACQQYQQQLQLMKIECSMSRVGNCYDNAAMERFWSTIKTEHVYRRRFASRLAGGRPDGPFFVD
ncbi:MAG: DDE-type integrase/transposase/recombinase [Phycisphaerales bacterium]|nr:DDE-type integrase/transposase/recombinase [Phycisphaerales bacterium]